VDQERFTELTWTFLLWGLPAPEQSEWEAELERRGAAGQAELARMREALAGLALASPSATPPAALRERVLAAIDEQEEATPAGPGDPSRGARKPTSGASVTSLPRRPWEWVAAAAVAASLAGLLAVWNVSLRSELGRLRSGLEEARRNLIAAEGRIAAADSARTELEAYRRDLDALASPAGSAHTLVGTTEQPNARARVFLDPQTGRAILFVYDLPVLPPQSVYELWAIKDGKPIAAGTFAPQGEARARVELEDPAVLEGADVLAVTVEPAPGGQAPTGKMVLSSAS
jgi:anti-sigma-K factor RskA